jgi:ATP-binding cassette subfamily F protein 3
LRKEVQRIEKRLATLESERAEIERLLASAEIYDGRQGAKIAELTARRVVVGGEIGALEDAWLEAQDALSRSD